MAVAARAAENAGPSGRGDLRSILPLELIRSQLVPPAPNRRRSAVDWLPDFGGFAWIAYGASSLLVVSHCPSPLTPEESAVGPFLRQVIESPCPDEVTAVAWRPSRPPDAHLAASAGKFVRVYAPGEADRSGALRWSQVATLVHSFTVEAIGWTGSGDGIISVGCEVIVWKKDLTSWEVFYKLKTDNHQDLVSATWSVRGPVATAPFSAHHHSIKDVEIPPLLEADRCVLIHQADGKGSSCTVNLWHPCSVIMIQWRPSSLLWANKSSWHPKREVLLTCCADGVVRLWSEIDGGRTKKPCKDASDQRNTNPSYHVIAVVEINQCRESVLCSDIFVSWGADIHAGISVDGNDDCFTEAISDDNIVGCCDWLIAMGPGPFLTFWAIHLLDDVSSLCFPRVTLWKKHELKDTITSQICTFRSSNDNYESVLIDAVISRNQSFCPPKTCSLLLLTHEHSLCWLYLRNLEQVDAEDSYLSYPSKEESLSCQVVVQNLDGHEGNILQIAVHPAYLDLQVAVSVDSCGILLFWSISNILPSDMGLESFDLPSWVVRGRYSLQNLISAPEYLNLVWVPVLIYGNRFLLVGHSEGIDCFLIVISDVKTEGIACNKLFTISFSHMDIGNGPYQIFVVPTAFTCIQSNACNKFMLIGIWMKEFQVISWELAIRLKDSSTCTCCNDSDATKYGFVSSYRFEFSHGNKSYYFTVDPLKSNFPSSGEYVISFAIPPDNVNLSIQMFSSEDFYRRFPIYHIATGSSNGELKFWRMKVMDQKFEHSGSKYLTWEIVGMLNAHQGALDIISLTNSGTNVATVSICNQHVTSEINIWRLFPLVNCGCFSLEHRIPLEGSIVALSWLELGDGQLLLGVCMQNELRVYCQTKLVDMEVLEGVNETTTLWSCIALCNTNFLVKDFLWSSKFTPMLVHDNSFSLFSRWSFPKGMVPRKEFSSDNVHGYSCALDGVLDDDPVQCVSSCLGNCDIREQLKFQPPLYSACDANLYNILSICGTLFGSLPVYHPKALIFYLYSGNCKRAHMALQHLIDLIHSDKWLSTNVKECSEGTRHFYAREVSLSKYFEAPENTANRKLDWNNDLSKMSDQQYWSIDSAWEGPLTSLSENSASGPSLPISLNRILDSRHSVPFLNDIERVQLLAVIDLVSELDNQHCLSTFKSFDEPARRFWIATRFKDLYCIRNFERSTSRNELIADSWMIAWAYHSDSQDSLFSSIFSPNPTWNEMRNMGVGYWFTDAMQLRSRMEKLARSQYLMKKDPKDCALLYLALNRLQVLSGLFRLSKDEKDKPLVGFLGRNFQEEKNKVAALKNAYVLLGRHQLELAIAFFLLGHDPSSAVMVCAKNFGDEQLALIICRLVEGFGGPLEQELITKVLLPNAINKGDYWLASMLEWTLGNYSKAFQHLAESCLHSEAATSCVFYNHASNADPNIGQYCAMLASNNKMRNSIGDDLAAMLFKWAVSASANALNKCGFPLEALECMSHWIGHSETREHNFQRHQSNMENFGILQGILNPQFLGVANWLSGDVAADLECSYFLNVSMRYVSKLLLQYPNWQHDGLVSPLVLQKELLSVDDENLINSFTTEINMAISFLHGKYFLRHLDIINMILICSYSSGMVFPYYSILHSYISNGVADRRINEHDLILLQESLPNMLAKSVAESFSFLSRCILYCNISESICGNITDENSHSRSYAWTVSFNNLIYSMWNLREFLKHRGSKMPKRDSFVKSLTVLDHIQLFCSFASAWCVKSLGGLIMIVSPILRELKKEESFHESIGGNVVDFLHRVLTLVGHAPPNRIAFSTCGKSTTREENVLPAFKFFDEKWKFIGASLWSLFHDFYRNQLYPLTVETSHSTGTSLLTETLPGTIAQSLKMSLAYTYSLLRKHIISFLYWKRDQGFHLDAIFSLKEPSSIGNTRGEYCYMNRSFTDSELTSNEDPASMLNWLFDISLRAGLCEGFLSEKGECLFHNRKKPCWCWIGVQMDFEIAAEHSVNSDLHRDRNSSIHNGDSNLLLGLQGFGKEGIIGDDRNGSKETTPFIPPKEIYKRTGELIEALCSNCVDEHEVVLASNRKGLLFFNWENGRCRRQADYIWPYCDWPSDAWAEANHTSVSPCVDLDSMKDAEPGLGGVAINTGTLARPGRDLTGGGAFGIPGYAGIGASGFGWNLQEGLEELMDSCATVDNISTRALSGHPSRPLFLVGSNSRAHLWKFGKENAFATYGTLPSALHPLALISALQFDHYGHRFASAAMDGLVCTWQVEVGGRRNIKPTDSSLCFSDHACNVAYVGPSGSIIASAGYSKNDVNIVLWDTLAPPTTSQASIVCHEGGATSLSVFNRGIDCGSMSPIIVTGGKNGDVALHDFRYIATGRLSSRRHKHSHEQNVGPSSSETSNGVLWYLERAHLGSVVKISTIPNTSLFLTAGKEGDVKLWDAKRAELVFHWPKLHEKNTFFGSTSRGGGIVRASVTDIQVLSDGFLSCGGDGTVKYIQLKDIH